MQKIAPNSSSVIFQTSNIDNKVYVKEQKGFYQLIRRTLGWLLTVLFIALPFIQYKGQQAILFDLEVQSLNLFSMVLYPQDMFIFVLILLFSAFALFFVSNKYGRIWCGYTCPQTIWSMMYLWVEHRVEGNRQQRIKLDKMPATLRKVAIKLLKHSIWFLIAVITATVFMSYFVPARDIYFDLVTFNISNLVFLWIVFFTLCTYINAGWIREKMCEHMCPYSRFQSVMFSSSTKVVEYDTTRGERRGPRKITSKKPNNLGDCVDCNLCVQVCPVGIDIREGLQYECISCGLCIDACDQTMDKFSYPRGLIKYSASISIDNKQPIKYSYAFILLTISALFIFWLSQRSQFEVSVVKDRNVLYREVDDRMIENTFQIKIFNKSKTNAEFEIQLIGLDNFTIKGGKYVSVGAQERTVAMVSVLSPKEYDKKFTSFEFNLEDLTDKNLITAKTTFHAP
ncbi:cytochrome c oxidase accessory protein CcoG [Thalassotalea psychrophila]|uniref:Cytochrome c oxidase accessory protein CcoG n=1 Tax=Thalassotalea psychrophila TaxID=3065647 RepID=A0ABY9TUB8_9GAMM|nr:cytochrome c oxidase accessory protein CcoG [Colwelliaceae bacterium SQ149]